MGTKRDVDMVNEGKTQDSNTKNVGMMFLNQ